MLRRPRRSADDFDAEIASHLELETDRLIEEGMHPAEARRAARRAFGNVTRSRERFREAGPWIWLDHLGGDLRYAWRQMVATPVSTATIVLSLALGIGVNAAVFSLADQALWRELPVRTPERLVSLDWEGRFIGGGQGWGALLPHPFYLDLRADKTGESGVFEDVFARAPFDVSVVVDGAPEPAAVEMVTGTYFPTLGVEPMLGRLIGEDDDREENAHPVAVLSHNFWQERFGGDNGVIGRRIEMNRQPLTVIGVAEPRFRGVDWSVAPDIWVPATMTDAALPGWIDIENRRTRYLHLFGRLRPGVTRAEAEVALQPWFQAYIEADTHREGWPQVTPEQLREYLASRLTVEPAARGEASLKRRVEEPLRLLLAATGLVLLLACLNVANLSLARALSSRRATAMRTALGASRGRIVREQLLETGLMAAVGCVAGLTLAQPATRVLLSMLPAQGAADLALSSRVDLRVLLFSAGVAAVTALVSGLAPALYAASTHPAAALKRSATAVASGLGLRRVLVVGQFALALVLLTGAGLMARTLGNLRAQGPGFETANLIEFDVNGEGFSKAMSRRLLEAIEALPEVERAAAANRRMLTGGSWNNQVNVELGRRILIDESQPMNAVTPGFFDTLGVRVTRGRNFDERDSREESDYVQYTAIVNEEFVREHLDGEDPVGGRLGLGAGPDSKATADIVGVVETFRDRGLREAEAQVFFPAWEMFGGSVYYVRTSVSAAEAAPALREAVRRVDPNLTIMQLVPVDAELDRLLLTERMLALLAVVFAALATALATIGLYAVVSFSAARRTREIGVRLALGASRWSAAGLILKEVAALAVAGLLVALPAAWLLGRLVESVLFGVRPMEPLVLAGAAAALALIGLLAGAAPARRASAIDPVEALRAE